MQSRIPLPTDNIYKFYALFGLMLLISSMASVVGLNASYNDKFVQMYIEYQELEKVDGLTNAQKAKKEMLEKGFEIARSDKKFFLDSLGVIFAVALFMAGFGFIRWHTKLQPLQDELARRQLDKVNLEMMLLEKQIRNARCLRR